MVACEMVGFYLKECRLKEGLNEGVAFKVERETGHFDGNGHVPATSALLSMDISSLYCLKIGI